MEQEHSHGSHVVYIFFATHILIFLGFEVGNRREIGDGAMDGIKEQCDTRTHTHTHESNGWIFAIRGLGRD